MQALTAVLHSIASQAYNPFLCLFYTLLVQLLFCCGCRPHWATCSTPQRRPSAAPCPPPDPPPLHHSLHWLKAGCCSPTLCISTPMLGFTPPTSGVCFIWVHLAACHDCRCSAHCCPEMSVWSHLLHSTFGRRCGCCRKTSNQLVCS